MQATSIKPKYVNLMPNQIEEGFLYICEPYQIAIHKCCCGCGVEVVTPLSPADWSIRKSGDLVSIMPSIGNWSFECKSHYWISDNQIIWATQFSEAQINFVRAKDKKDKEDYIKEINFKKEQAARPESFIMVVWNALVRWWHSLFNN